MAITEEQVKHVAKLSKLSFSEEELADFTNQLDKITGICSVARAFDTRATLQLLPLTQGCDGREYWPAGFLRPVEIREKGYPSWASGFRARVLKASSVQSA